MTRIKLVVAAAAVASAAAVGLGSVASAAEPPAVAQPSVPDAARGAQVQTTITIGNADGSRFPAANGSVMTFTAPQGTTILDITCAEENRRISDDGKEATCTTPAQGTWNWWLERRVELLVDATATPGTATGTFSLTSADGGELASLDYAVEVLATARPGTFCRDADQGKRAMSPAGRPLTCMHDAGDTRARWRY